MTSILTALAVAAVMLAVAELIDPKRRAK